MTLGSQLHVLTQPTRTRLHCAPPSRASSPATPTGTSANSRASLRSLADNVHTPIELHLFSDMQKSEMPANFAELALPANVSLVLHPVVKNPRAELDG